MYDLNDYVFRSDNFTEIKELKDNHESEMEYASNDHTESVNNQLQSGS